MTVEEIFTIGLIAVLATAATARDLRRVAQLDGRLLRSPVRGVSPSDVLVGESVAGILRTLPSPGV